MSEVIVSEEYLRAEAVHKKVKATVHSAKMTFIELGKLLKEMRDGKLYKELGYQNFEEYCEVEAEITRRHAYSMISIAENLPEDFVKSFHKIGTTKLTLLAMLPQEEREAVTETVNVETVTVRELKAQIERLETDKASKDKQFQAALASKQTEIDELRTGGKRRTDMLIKKIEMLKADLDAARAEPKTVAVEDTSRVEELEQQLARAQSELADANARLAERPMVQEALPVRDTTDAFKAYLSAAADSMKRLLEFVGNRPGDPNHELYLTRIDGVLHLSGTELAKLKGESSCR